MKKLLFLVFCLCGLLVFFGFEYNKAQQLDRYVFKRTVDGFFNTFLKLKPFGGGPYELSQDSVYMEGVYIVQKNTSTGKATYAGAAGTVTKIDEIYYTISLKDSAIAIKILPNTLVYVSVPDVAVSSVKKEITGDVKMIEVGDRLQCMGIDIENKCEIIYLVKSFYDRTKI